VYLTHIKNRKTNDLFDLEDKIIIYDLMNFKRVPFQQKSLKTILLDIRKLRKFSCNTG